MGYADLVQQVQLIFKHLGDEESKHVFEHRCMYSLTQDNRYIKDMVESSVQTYRGGGRLLKSVNSKRPKYLFGAGYYGDLFIQMWPEGILAILDNNRCKWGKRLCNIDIISPQSADFSQRPLIFVTPWNYHQEIKLQLMDMGIQEQDIIDVGEIWEEIHRRQYFDLPALRHSAHERFADVGSYDGRTASEFVRWSGGQYEHIYCFEPVSSNKMTIRGREFAQDRRFTLIGKGVGESSGELHMYMSGKMATSLWPQTQAVSLPITTLDAELVGKGITYISMDIEGMELSALKGAENIIIKERPQLAISIYHKFEDIFEIPKLLLGYHDDFIFYLRHYFLGGSDTVLYAL